jgi:hypothetical protein
MTTAAGALRPNLVKLLNFRCRVLKQHIHEAAGRKAEKKTFQ